MLSRPLTALVLCLVGLAVLPSSASDHLAFEDIDHLRGFLGGVRNLYWPPGKRVIAVCWENTDAKDEATRTAIRSAINDSWGAHSTIHFVGWDACRSEQPGIHILLADIRPDTPELGTDLDGVDYGMRLNPDFRSQGSSYCRAHVDFCIRATAVHEFGHALGFVHENLLEDAPDECLAEKGSRGTIPNAGPITAYDLHSIMNYCNPSYLGDGTLSKLDIEGLQGIYGAPNTKGAGETKRTPAVTVGLSRTTEISD
jgi:hypothetical protein